MNEKENMGLSAQREKYWSEIDINEKVERTRREVKSLMRMIDRIGQKQEKISRLFYAHGHDTAGELIKKITDSLYDEEPERDYSRYGRITDGKNQDEVYF